MVLCYAAHDDEPRGQLLDAGDPIHREQPRIFILLSIPNMAVGLRCVDRSGIHPEGIRRT